MDLIWLDLISLNRLIQRSKLLHSQYDFSKLPPHPLTNCTKSHQLSINLYVQLIVWQEKSSCRFRQYDTFLTFSICSECANVCKLLYVYLSILRIPEQGFSICHQSSVSISHGRNFPNLECFDHYWIVQSNC